MAPRTAPPPAVTEGTSTGPGDAARLPVVVVAGRPNVGKSTLVNRVVRRRVAVVEEAPGITRDRLELDAEWNGHPFRVVDTGGWLAAGDSLETKVAEQARRAIEEADLVLVVVDVTVGVTTEDEQVARVVTRAGVPFLLVANKVDNSRREAEAWELLSLGLGDPRMVSALHGRGTGDLLDEVVARLETNRRGASGHGATTRTARANPSDDDAASGAGTAPGAGLAAGAATDADRSRQASADRAQAEPSDGGAGREERDAAGRSCPRVAIAGRPNVGKSTLFNRLVGQERSVVHDVPGTTRDAVDTVVDDPEGPVRFVDTAGMRRRSRHAPGTEYFAMVRALQAIDRADVVLLVIDATEGVTHQDQRLAERIGASGSPVVLVLNKWELTETEARRRVVADVEDRLAFLGETPVLRISARTGLGVHRIVGALRRAVEAYHRRVPTGELNRVLAAIQAAHRAPGSRIRYAVQGATDPPTFTLFATRRLPPTYLRYVERRLREEFGLGATPLKLRVRLGG